MHGLSETDVLDLADHDAERQRVDATRALVAHAYPDLDDAAIDLLPLGSCDRALIQLRTATFGSAMALTAECPRCANLLEVDVEADALIVPDPPARTMARLRRLTVGERHLVLRPINGTDVAKALRSGGSRNPRAVLAARCCVDEASGGEVEAAMFDEDALAVIADRLAKLDPQSDLMLDVVCVACDYRWQPVFDIAAVFWREIRIRAGIIIGDICELARAFHWTERDILALSAMRRSAYLALVR